jgi:hypothetical protein
MKNNNFDGFTVNILLDEDGDWLAHLVELLTSRLFRIRQKRQLTSCRLPRKE